MNKAITLILVILCSLLLWIDIVYKKRVEIAEAELKVAELILEVCETNAGIMFDFNNK